MFHAERGHVLTFNVTHTRGITDVTFNSSSPNIIASCSADASIILWDIRLPNPISTLRSKQHVITARFPRADENSYYLASVYSHDIHIWDTRMFPSTFSAVSSKESLFRLIGHNNQIESIDWSYLQADQLASSSIDNSLKIWNLGAEQKVKHTRSFLFGNPVSQASYLPIGNGLVAFSNSKTYRNLHMLSLVSEKKDAEVHVFKGHAEVIRRMRFRVQSPHFQVCTLSFDNVFRMWRVPFYSLQACGVSYGEDFVDMELPLISIAKKEKRGSANSTPPVESPASSKNEIMSPPRMISGKRNSAPQIVSVAFSNNSIGSNSMINASPPVLSRINLLGIELEQLPRNFKECIIEKRSGRFCQLLITDSSGLNGSIRLQFTFPTMYPSARASVNVLQASGCVQFLDPIAIRNQLMLVSEECESKEEGSLLLIVKSALKLIQLTLQFSKLDSKAIFELFASGKSAFETVKRQLTEFQSISKFEDSNSLTMQPFASSAIKIMPTPVSITFEKEVLCPSLCGAVFSPNGNLVFFSNPRIIHYYSEQKAAPNFPRRYQELLLDMKKMSEIEPVIKKEMNVFEESDDSEIDEIGNINLVLSDDARSDKENPSPVTISAQKSADIPKAYASQPLSSNQLVTPKINDLLRSYAQSPEATMRDNNSVSSSDSKQSNTPLIDYDDRVELLDEQTNLASISLGAIQSGLDASSFEDYFFAPSAANEVAPSENLNFSVGVDLPAGSGSAEMVVEKAAIVDMENVSATVIPVLPKKSSPSSNIGSEIPLPVAHFFLKEYSNLSLKASTLPFKIYGLSAHELCLHNERVSREAKRDDLAEIWRVAALITRPRHDVIVSALPWSVCQFEDGMVRKLISYAKAIGEISILACLVCVFALPPQSGGVLYSNSDREYMDTYMECRHLNVEFRPSNVKSRSLVRLFDYYTNPKSLELDRANFKHQVWSSLPSLKSLNISVVEALCIERLIHDTWRLRYTEALYFSSMFIERAEMLKFVCKYSLLRPVSSIHLGAAEKEIAPKSLVSISVMPNSKPISSSLSSSLANLQEAAKSRLLSGLPLSPSLPMLNSGLIGTQKTTSFNAVSSKANVVDARQNRRSLEAVAKQTNSIEESGLFGCSLCIHPNDFEGQHDNCIFKFESGNNVGVKKSRLLPICAFCRTIVFGLISFCVLCNHGGHAQHMKTWFEENNSCPSGCGCLCIGLNL